MIVWAGTFQILYLKIGICAAGHYLVAHTHITLMNGLDITHYAYLAAR